MTIKLAVISALIFTVTLVKAPLVIAHTSTHHEDCVLNAVEKLDLHPEQKIKIKLFAHKAKMQITLKRHELHTIGLHIQETFHSGDMNIAKIDTFAKQNERVMGSIAKIRLLERYKIYQTLTVQQREKMDRGVEECLKSHIHQSSGLT